jgi:transketolase
MTTKLCNGALAAVPFVAGKPSCLIARTTKGKGVSFMENTVLWHYRIPRGPSLTPHSLNWRANRERRFYRHTN